MSLSSIHLSTPPGHYFQLPPPPEPYALSPSTDEGTFKSPFAIDATIYNAALSPALPLTFGSVYLLSVFALNQVNRRRNGKPWAISKSPIFYALVVLHNVFLAVYSAVTCAAMIRAVSVSWPSIGEYGVPGAVDALCKIHGPRGFGDAITYNSTTSLWSSKSYLIKLADDGILPDTTDVGRIWNEGLAFWGWFFYLSKFYEVVDTIIILAKGKRASTLQSYHHAGAMLCMWAGIRYMSPPIWMFVLVNSGIHAMMYTYYTLTTLGYKISNRIKGVITTMQITQFLVGASFAAAHLFISYSVPVSLPYTVVSAVEAIVSEISAAASSISEDPGAAFASATSSVAAAVATATIDLDKHAWFKKLAFRAAGFEGLAEAVRDKHGETFGLEHDTRPLKDALRRIERPKFVEEIRYRTEYQEVHCLDTDGQAFAIWLNVAYLMPLTILFLRFFVKTYIWGSAGRKGKKPRTLSDSAVIAAKQASRFIEHLGKEAEDTLGDAVEDLDDEYHLKDKAVQLKTNVKEAADSFSMDDAVARIRRNFSGVANGAEAEVEDVLARLQALYDRSSEKLHVKEIVTALEEKASQVAATVSGTFEEVKHEAKETFSEENIDDSVESLKQELDRELSSSSASIEKLEQKAVKQEEKLEAKMLDYESGGESSRSELNASPTKGSRIPQPQSSKGRKKDNKHQHHGHHGHTPGQGSPTASLTYAEVTDPMLPNTPKSKA